MTVREGARATAIDARGVTVQVGESTERIDARTVARAAGVGAPCRWWPRLPTPPEPKPIGPAAFT